MFSNFQYTPVSSGHAALYDDQEDFRYKAFIGGDGSRVQALEYRDREAIKMPDQGELEACAWD